MTAATNSALRAELGICLEGLQRCVDQFASHIQFYARDAWTWCAPAPADEAGAADPPVELPREQTLEVIGSAVRAIKYIDGQAAHESRISPGLVVVSQEGILLADEVNRYKRSLAAVLRAMEGRVEMGTVDQRSGEQGERPLREVALEKFFFRRLHPWQATRELVVLRETADFIGTPDYVSYMWARCREVRRTSREILMESLAATRATSVAPTLVDHDIAALADLPPGEPLAVVAPGRISPKANVSWPAGLHGEVTRRTKVAVLPLVMFGERRPARFRKLPLSPTPKHLRLARSDTELEPTPVLGTMAVYRYLTHLRDEKRAALAHKGASEPKAA